MSRNRIATVILTFLLVIGLFFIGLKLWIYAHPQDFRESDSAPLSSQITTEDDLIMQGLWYEEQKDFANSYKVFSKLYETNHAKVYLLKKIHLSLLMNKYLDFAKKELEILYANDPDDIEVLRLRLTLYLMQKDYENAKTEAVRLLDLSKDPVDREISSDAFLYANDPNKALAILKELYDESSREDVAMRIAIILSDMYGEHQQAIGILQEHGSKYESQDALHKKLLDLYAKTSNTDGIIQTSKLLYGKTKDDKYLNNIITIAWQYYEEGQCAKAQEIIKNIPDTKVLSKPEAKAHWLEIKKCDHQISGTTTQVHNK